LLPGGRLLVVGSTAAIEIGSTDLCWPRASVEGSLTGSAQDGEDTLNFSVLQKHPLHERNHAAGKELPPATHAYEQQGAFPRRAHHGPVMTTSPAARRPMTV